MDQSQSVLVIFGPNWPIMVCFDHFGSELANHGPFWLFWAQISRRLAILIGGSKKFPYYWFSYQIESQVPFSFSLFLFLLFSQWIRQKFTNWRLIKETKIFIFDLEQFQFWLFKNSDPTIFGSFFINLFFVLI